MSVSNPRRSATRSRFSFVLLPLLAASCQGIHSGFATTFGAGEWNASDWIMVKSARWPHRGGWVQHADSIENETPGDATPKEMLSARAGETYTSMVTRTRFRSGTSIEMRASFAERMAPALVLAPELGTDADGYPEYREHLEIVMFDQGVNVWGHVYEDGKPSWRRVAAERFPLSAGQVHDLHVLVHETGGRPTMEVRVGTHRFEVVDDAVPVVFHAGVTGCEGRNRFFGIRIRAGLQAAESVFR